MIDLRSDTVTRPTPAMRQAMVGAEVGDDVYGEDPTVNRLQRISAQLLGKEEALFVPSGTMGNLISVLIHCPRGSEVILGDESHIYNYEQGGASHVGGCVLHPVRTQADGTLALEDIRGSVRDPRNVHNAAPGVICLENTHNRCGGAVLSVEYVKQVRALADELKLPMHLDGARLANAAVALKTPIKTLAGPFESVQFDLSKGLGAPVGGIVAGSRGFIDQAKRYRKLLGGGMRQAGVIAAAGIVAIEQMIERLAEDHQRARRVAEALAESGVFAIDPASVETNIVLAAVKRPNDPKQIVEKLKKAGVLVNPPNRDRIRFVMHYDVSEADIETLIQTLHQWR